MKYFLLLFVCLCLVNCDHPRVDPPQFQSLFDPGSLIMKIHVGETKSIKIFDYARISTKMYSTQLYAPIFLEGVQIDGICHEVIPLNNTMYVDVDVIGIKAIKVGTYDIGFDCCDDHSVLHHVVYHITITPEVKKAE